MSRVPISPRDVRALWLGGLIVLIAVTLTWVVRPSLQRRALLADQLAAEQGLLERERTILAAAGTSREAVATRDSLAALVAEQAFTGANPTIASAALAEYVSAVARANDVWLQSTATRPPVVGRAGIHVLRIEIRAIGDVRGLLRFLHVLEAGHKVVQLEQLDVSGAALTVDDGTAPLMISATLIGYTVPGDSGSRIPRGAEQVAALSQSTVAIVEQLAARDLFAAERQAPDAPFGIGSRSTSPSPTQAPASLAGEVEDASGLPRVLGTAVDAQGNGFAMAALSGGPIVVVRVGDLLGSYRVLSIERARVLFRDALGQRHTVDATASPDGAVP